MEGIQPALKVQIPSLGEKAIIPVVTHHPPWIDILQYAALRRRNERGERVATPFVREERREEIHSQRWRSDIAAPVISLCCSR